MPLPEDVSVCVEEVASGWDAVVKGVMGTQVARDRSDGVPGWIGEDADAYTGSIKRLGEHARGLGERIGPASEALRTWGAAVRKMITTTVPEFWERYNEAIRVYNKGIDDLNEEIEASNRRGEVNSGADWILREACLEDDLKRAQDKVIADYKTAMDGLDDDAQTAATAIQNTLDTIVDPSLQGSRNRIGAAMFNDIPVVDGQAEWEQAQSEAGPAASIINGGFPTEQDIRDFQEKYGELCKNPFFARALAERVDPEAMTRFLVQAQKLRYGAGKSSIDASLNSICASLGSAVSLATGGMNADPALVEVNETFEASRAGLVTDAGGSVEALEDARLEQWKKVGNQLFDGNGNPVEQDGMGIGAVSGRHYGYEYLGEMFDGAAKSNPNLALGAKAMSGADSLANDIVAFDHTHKEELTNPIGSRYGEWVGGIPPGGDPHSTDVVESVLRLMDEPEALSDGGIAKDSPAWDALSAQNAKRLEATQSFLASDTTFDVKSSEALSRKPHYAGEGPMNMTRYLTGFRGNAYYSGTQDGGDALGRVIAQATTSAPKPQEPMSFEEYQAWARRTEQPAKIAGNLLLGYQEGLEIDNGNENGQDPYGKAHDKLRGWVGLALAPHVEGITNSMGSADSQGEKGEPDLAFTAPQPFSHDGYMIKLGSDLRNRIIGANGLFTDLAFDQRADLNGTPDNPNDDRTPSGHPPALNTLMGAASAGYQEDLRNSLSPDYAQPSIPVEGRLISVQKKWAHLMGAMTVAPADSTAQVKEAIECHNREIDAAVKEWLTSVPFGNLLGKGRDFAKWVLDRVKGAVIPEAGKAFWEEPLGVDPKEEKRKAQQMLENLMRDLTYQAISEGNYWGEDPARTPAGYFGRGSMGVDFRNGENTVLPYKDMSPGQRNSFQDYIIGEGGLKSVYGDVLGAVGGALEEARARRIQARDE